MNAAIPSAPLLVRGGRLLDPAVGLDRVADVLLDQGRVVEIGGELAPPPGTRAFDAAGLVVAPGLIDLHAELGEPGHEERETIASGTLAAARGGYTTVVCLPDTTPPLDSRAALDYVRERAGDAARVRVLALGAVTHGCQGTQLAAMGELAEAGAVGFADGYRPVADAALMRHALTYGRMFGRPVFTHCELRDLAGGVVHEGVVASWLGLKGIPAASEEAALARDLALLELTGGRLHVMHVSTARAVDQLRAARRSGLAVTADVTPHHLTMTDEAVATFDTATKVNPPLRSETDVAALLEGLRDGTIEAIASDHSPRTWVEKECEFGAAAWGMSTLETAFASLLGLVAGGALDLPTLLSRLVAGPAAVLGIEPGRLTPGGLADLVLFDPHREWIVDPEALASRGKNTALAGRRLRGKVAATIVAGRLVGED